MTGAWRWVPFVVALAFAGGAWADARPYVNATGDFFGYCNFLGLGFGQGEVCFEAGHVQPDSSGFVTFSILDAVVNPASGQYQQDDVNVQPFCGALTVAAGVNFDPSRRVQIFLDGPVFGGPTASPCGPFSFSPATAGDVSHS